MDLSNLQPPAGAKHSKKRVGRGPGSGTGKTAGRGHKGQKSRSGFRRKRGFEGGQMPLHRRVPKRGFHNPFRIEYAVVNLDDLAQKFESGAVVTVEALREHGLVRSRTARIKVLGRGELDRPLVVQAHKFSASAATKIGAAGGRAETVPPHTPAPDRTEAAADTTEGAGADTTVAAATDTTDTATDAPTESDA